MSNKGYLHFSDLSKRHEDKTSDSSKLNSTVGTSTTNPYQQYLKMNEVGSVSFAEVQARAMSSVAIQPKAEQIEAELRSLEAAARQRAVEAAAARQRAVEAAAARQRAVEAAATRFTLEQSNNTEEIKTESQTHEPGGRTIEVEIRKWQQNNPQSQQQVQGA